MLLFFPPVSYSAVTLQSIDCFCSFRRLIASLLARFALVRRRNCFCSYSHQFRFSPSIVYALLLARSASVRRLFLLFSSINSFSSRQFRSSLSIVSAVLLQSVDCFCSSSRPFSFSPPIVYTLLVYSSRQFRSSSSITSAHLLLMDLGGVKRKMARKNCERTNAVKTVNGYVFLNVGTP